MKDCPEYLKIISLKYFPCLPIGNIPATNIIRTHKMRNNFCCVIISFIFQYCDSIARLFSISSRIEIAFPNFVKVCRR